METKFIDVILQFLDNLKFWEIINYFDRGVHLRFGKPKLDKKSTEEIKPPKELVPGIYFKIPFIDTIYTIMVKTTTMPLKEQTVTTKDNTSLVVKAVIKYTISNAPQVLLEVNDPIDAIADMTAGIIRSHIIELNYSECNTDKLAKEVLTASRREAKKWGIYIDTVTLTDLGKMTSIRLLNTTSTQENYDIVR